MYLKFGMFFIQVLINIEIVFIASQGLFRIAAKLQHYKIHKRKHTRVIANLGKTVLIFTIFPFFVVPQFKYLTDPV